MKRLLTTLLFILTLFATTVAFAAETISVDAPVDQIKSYGNVILPLTADDMRDAGYAFGDLIDVSFGNQTVTMPYCTNFSDVDSGCPELVFRSSHNHHVLVRYNGDFATAYSFAEKTDKGWFSEEGDFVHVTISMNTPAGYYDEYILHSIAYTDDRSDYPELTDAEFANFRVVTTPGMAQGMLYRSASPLSNEHNRASYAAEAMESAGICVVLNLADSDDEMRAYEAYGDSYYASVDVIGLDMTMDFSTADNMQRMADGMRFLLTHDGPILVHCQEGKDRTGFVCAVLELLTGASIDDVYADYMITYSNYYGITESSEAYPSILRSFENNLRTNLGDDLSAESYLLRCGLANEEIAALIARLQTAPLL